MNITLGYIDPVAFSLGPIQVRWYGIIIACGILLGYFIAQAALKQVGLHTDTLIDIIFYSDCWIHSCENIFCYISMAILHESLE